MTLKEAYQYGESVLSEAGNPEARLDAWLLLEHVSKVSRALYYISENQVLNREEEQSYKSFIQRRAGHVPLQHITGVQEFMGLEFLVNENVLIPRQDTETLVEEALNILKTSGKSDCRILDMCTGSGCILLSILYYAGRFMGNTPKPQLSGVGADVSPQALEVAVRNAAALGIQADFCQSDLFEQLDQTYFMIVSNPPYIRTSEIEKLQKEVKEFDPMLALDGKMDGLHFYRRIVEEAGNYLEKQGYLLFEIGYDQGSDVMEMMKKAGYKDVAVKKDLAGLDRVVIGVYDR